MREVTIHLAPGETDRELARALQALDPRAQVHLVTGRHGRTGVRVCAHLALRYLAAVDILEQVGLATEDTVTATSAEPAPPVAEAVPTASEAVETPAPKKAAPAKKAAKKAALAADKIEEV